MLAAQTNNLHLRLSLTSSYFAHCDVRPALATASRNFAISDTIQFLNSSGVRTVGSIAYVASLSAIAGVVTATLIAAAHCEIRSAGVPTGARIPIAPGKLISGKQSSKIGCLLRRITPLLADIV